VLGIVVSVIGIIGSIACFLMGLWDQYLDLEEVFANSYTIGAVLLIIMIPYLAMWILLKIKTNKKDIPGIERIGKVYSYVSGSLEIITMIAWIIYSAWGLASFIWHRSGITLFQDGSEGPLDLLEIWRLQQSIARYTKLSLFIGINSVFIIGAVIYFVFACLKIHGIRVDNNKLIGIYLGFRYGLFALHMIGFIILSIYGRNAIIGLIIGGVYFILDIGLTVILHSIRVDRENTAEGPVRISRIQEIYSTTTPTGFENISRTLRPENYQRNLSRPPEIIHTPSSPQIINSECDRPPSYESLYHQWNKQ